MKIESVSQADIPELMMLIKTSFDESIYKHYNYNIQYFKDLLSLCQNPDRFQIMAINNDIIVGYFLAHITSMGFCDYEFGMDDGFYVLPEYRGSTAFGLMFKSYLKWCESKAVKSGAMIHYAEEKHRLYAFMEKMEMIEHGRLFIGK